MAQEQHNYTAAEYASMIYMYGLANGNGEEAARLYEQRFPNRRPLPVARTILRAYNRLSETGCVMRNNANAGAPRRVRTPQLEEQIIDDVLNRPDEGIRRFARRAECSYWTTRAVIHEEGLHDYHYRKVQNLDPRDNGRRVEFCTWILNSIQGNPDFLRNVIFSDESHFGRLGTWNTRNSHMYAYENPHLVVINSHQRRFSLNVWAAIIDDRLVCSLLYLFLNFFLLISLQSHCYLISIFTHFFLNVKIPLKIFIKIFTKKLKIPRHKNIKLGIILKNDWLKIIFKKTYFILNKYMKNDFKISI